MEMSQNFTPTRPHAPAKDLAWERGFSLAGEKKGGGHEKLQDQAQAYLNDKRDELRDRQKVDRQQTDRISELAKDIPRTENTAEKAELTKEINQTWKALTANQKEDYTKAWQAGENTPQALLAGLHSEIKAATKEANDARTERTILADSGKLMAADIQAGIRPMEKEAYYQKTTENWGEQAKQAALERKDVYKARDEYCKAEVTKAEGVAGATFDSQNPPKEGEKPWETAARAEARAAFVKSETKHVADQAREHFSAWRQYGAQERYAADNADKGVVPLIEKPAGERPAGPAPAIHEIDRAKRELQPEMEKKAEANYGHAVLNAFCAEGKYENGHVTAMARDLDARDRISNALAVYAHSKEPLTKELNRAERTLGEQKTDALSQAKEQARGRLPEAQRYRAERVLGMADRVSDHRVSVGVAQAVVKSAVEVQKDRSYAGIKASPETLMKYEKLSNQLDRQGRTPHDAAKTKASFDAYRAATVRDATEAGKQANKDFNSAVRDERTIKAEAREMGFHGPDGLKTFREMHQDKNEKLTEIEGRKADAGERLQAAAAVLQRYEPGAAKQSENWQRERDFKPDLENARSTSKREAEGRLERNWQDKIFDSANRNDKPAVAMLSVGGVRPDELSRGVKVQRQADGGLKLTVKGSKSDTFRGAPIREISLSKEQVDKDKQAAYLHKLAGERGGTSVKVEDTKALSERIARLGDKQGLDVSGYSFRHGYATDNRLEGRSDKEFGPEMGHRSDRSTAGYGS